MAQVDQKFGKTEGKTLWKVWRKLFRFSHILGQSLGQLLRPSLAKFQDAYLTQVWQSFKTQIWQSFKAQIWPKFGQNFIILRSFELNLHELIRTNKNFYLRKISSSSTNAIFNVLKFLWRYSRMGWRRVKGKKVPKDAPNHTDCTSSVENNAPTKVRDEKTSQRISYSNSEAEPCTTTEQYLGIKGQGLCSSDFYFISLFSFLHFIFIFISSHIDFLHFLHFFFFFFCINRDRRFFFFDLLLLRCFISFCQNLPIASVSLSGDDCGSVGEWRVEIERGILPECSNGFCNTI